MPSEVIEGKRTFIERHGQVVERPFRHTVEFTDLGDGTTSVSLMALVQGSSFHLREVEEWRIAQSSASVPSWSSWTARWRGARLSVPHDVAAHQRHMWWPT